MALTLYRRHRKNCEKKYPQNYRVFKPTNKTERSADCDCPINAEGSLRVLGIITNRSTKKSNWGEAEQVARHWEDWGQLTPPANDDGSKFVTVQYAVESFGQSQGPQGRNVEPKTYNAFRILLEDRLLPYCEAHGFSYLREFESLDVITKFFESWRNLQPTRNRKNVLAPTEPVPLKESTKKSELDRLRFFLEYCRARGWLSANNAKKLKVPVKTDKKFGMEPEEEERFFAQIAVHCINGRGNNGGYNAQQLRVFCLLMRHSGLRISDATLLNEEQLVRRASGNGSGVKLFQKKTREWVYIPIPDWVAAELTNLPFRGEKHGVRYWFWTAVGEPDTCSDNWYRRIQSIVKAVEKTRKFAHSVSPHTFRHTFAISHLNAGTDIKFVSRWLGHKSSAVTEKHYSHAIHSTMIASEAAYDESVKRQQDFIARRRRDDFSVSTASSSST